jgi:uncharacterized protein YraI
MMRYVIITFLLGACAQAWATADGPDYYRVSGVSAGSSLNMRAGPRADAAVIMRIPADAQCLKSRGCRGGLTFEEFSTLPKHEQQRRMALNPRWCKVEYQGSVGWVAGRFVTEGACPDFTHKEKQP